MVILKNHMEMASDESKDESGNKTEHGVASDLIEFCKEPKSRQEIAEYLGLKTLYHVTKTYIDPLVKSKQLFMTIPEHPKSRNQKFYSVRQ